MIPAPTARVASYVSYYFYLGILVNSLWERDFVGSDHTGFKSAQLK